MLRPENNSDKRFFIALGVITLIGLLLRLHGLSSESMTADEVSALFRLQFPGFSLMIENGVRPDGHPAFTQVLLWFWTKCFGLNEFAVRFPFVIFGTAGIWLSGIIAKKWFSNSAGLTTAAGISFLQFTIMYSQLARPYAPGLFFTLLATYFWTKLVKEKSAAKKDIAGFAFAAALAAYSHYFSLLTIFLLGIAGIFFAGKEFRKKYLFACAMAILLFVPHISISLSQIEKGGIGGPGGWLGKPTPAFFMNHLKFVFNESRGMMWMILIIAIAGLLFFIRKRNKFQILALLIWFLPFAIGYFYSVYVNPVLQNSVLLFSFPFLLLFLFSWIPDFNSRKIAAVFPIGFSLVFLFYIIIYKPFHLTEHFGRLKELVSNTVDWQKKFGVNNVDVAYNVDGDYMVNYYYDRLKEKPQHVLTTIVKAEKDLLKFKKLVESSNAEYFVYGWSTRYSSLNILPIIEEKFPFLVEKHEWFNSAIYIFSVIEPSSNLKRKNVLFESEKEFEESVLAELEEDSLGNQRETSLWTKACNIQVLDSSRLNFISDIVNDHYVPHIDMSINYAVRLDSSCVYSPSLTKRVGDISLKNPDNTLLFTALVIFPSKKSDLILVTEFDRDGKQLYWNGIESVTQIDTTQIGQCQNVYLGVQPPEDLKLTDEVKFYCYTKTGNPILLLHMDVKTLKGHTGIYGPRPDFK